MLAEARLHLRSLVVHVLRREVVHDEVHLIDRLRVRDGHVLVRRGREEGLEVKRRREARPAAARRRRAEVRAASSAAAEEVRARARGRLREQACPARALRGVAA
eukprot:19771-Pelagococcus_subviridis.AAC.3